MPNRNKQVRLSVPLTCYPFCKDSISKAEAVELIRVVIYPSLYRKDAVRLIRSRIDYGVKKGLVPRDGVFNSAGFFSWAITQKEWGGLASLSGIPLLPNSGGVCAEIGALTAEGFGVSIPSDIEELRSAFRKVSLENYEISKQLREVNMQYHNAMDELFYLRSKYKNRVESSRQNARNKRLRLH